MARSKSISTIDNEISKITDEIIKLRRKEISNDISALLAKNQSLLASSNSTDEIDEEDDYDGTFEEYFYN